MGAMATEMVVKLVNEESLPINPAEEGNLYKIPAQLVIRESCASAPCHSPDEPSGESLAAK
jgi:DNA-binding LacI/PurR family transcriptional regulator